MWIRWIRIRIRNTGGGKVNKLQRQQKSCDLLYLFLFQRGLASLDRELLVGFLDEDLYVLDQLILLHGQLLHFLLQTSCKIITV
jgi:hypothetical protein